MGAAEALNENPKLSKVTRVMRAPKSSVVKTEKDGNIVPSTVVDDIPESAVEKNPAGKKKKASAKGAPEAANVPAAESFEADLNQITILEKEPQKIVEADDNAEVNVETATPAAFCPVIPEKDCPDDKDIDEKLEISKVSKRAPRKAALVKGQKDAANLESNAIVDKIVESPVKERPTTKNKKASAAASVEVELAAPSRKKKQPQKIIEAPTDAIEACEEEKLPKTRLAAKLKASEIISSAGSNDMSEISVLLNKRTESSEVERPANLKPTNPNDEALAPLVVKIKAHPKNKRREAKQQTETEGVAAPGKDGDTHVAAKPGELPMEATNRKATQSTSRIDKKEEPLKIVAGESRAKKAIPLTESNEKKVPAKSKRAPHIATV